MTRFESDSVQIDKPASEVFSFLSDFKNIGSLMPPQVENFITDGEVCSFDIKGMASLGMKYGTKTPNSEVVMSKHEKGPFDFNLICSMRELTPGCTELQLFFDADVNPFLRMMAEKPLTNFLNLLVKRYKEMNAPV